MEINWKKKYNEALERARALREEAIEKEYVNDYVKDYEAIFPELAESEDDKIRKWMINEIKAIYDFESPYLNPMVKKALAYLEKQKAQKPKNILTNNDSLRTAYLKGQTDVLEDPEAYGLQKEQKPEWSDEDKRKLNRIYAIIGQAADTHAFSNTCRLIGDKEAVELQDFLRSIAKPKSYDWSEEDEKMVETICEEGYLKPSERCWLKSLKNRGNSQKSNTNSPSWKPSVEQMGIFGRIVNDLKIKRVGVTVKEHHTLESLYNDIKKLM